MKAMLRETKENVQGMNSKGKEIRTQIHGLEQKEEITFNQNRINQQEFFKNEERLRNLWDNSKCSNIRIIGVPEGEEEEQKVENLFEQIMKENFPNLSKEINFQEVQEAQRVPKKLDPMKHTPRHIIITLPKIKEERILKAAREKKTITFKGVLIRISADFKRNLAGRKGLERSIQSHERQGPTSKMTLSSKAIT